MEEQYTQVLDEARMENKSDAIEFHSRVAVQGAATATEDGACPAVRGRAALPIQLAFAESLRGTGKNHPSR